jgi:hypothetical protein
MLWLYLGLAASGGVVLFLYIFLFIFLSGEGNRGRAYDKFIMAICSPQGDGAFFMTVFTFGYLKRTWKRFLQHYRLKLFPQPTATLNKPAPDAAVVTLSGEKRSLLKDFIQETQKMNMPLILNMGSYT